MLLNYLFTRHSTVWTILLVCWHSKVLAIRQRSSSDWIFHH